MAIILPHGVLFRGGAEERIRTKLVKDGPTLSEEKQAKLKELIRNKLSSRLGWQPRCKPLQLPSDGGPRTSAKRISRDLSADE